ncbi:hypothetical protein BLD44_021440 [Mastigocladus laminosus UU774]|nr:hypothetical protein BLD44_021440 [Mastigocladus laminosus UU774]
MNLFKEIFWKIADELKILDNHKVLHKQLGVFHERYGYDEHVQISKTSCPPADLWRLIYLHYHAADVDGVQYLQKQQRTPRFIGALEDLEYVAQLEEANSGTGYFDPGWQVIYAQGSYYIVRRGDLTLKVEQCELHQQNTATSDSVSVRFPNSFRYAYPGCYLAISNQGLCRAGEKRLVRLYFNLESSLGAVTFMSAITSLLNDRAVRFQIKVMNHPKRLRRRDNFILYVPDEVWRTYRSEVAEVQARHQDLLREDVPGFTLPLGRGWSFAEEPIGITGMLSFGQHRAQLAADGIYSAYIHGAQTVEERLSWIAWQYRKVGLDITHPYLNPKNDILNLP